MSQPSKSSCTASYVAETVETADPKLLANYWELRSVLWRVFIEWEKLRPIYIVVLVVVCLVTAIFTQAYVLPEFWFCFLFFGIGVNLSFFVGTAVETSWIWLRRRETKAVHFGLFLIGLILSVVMVIVATIDLANTALLPVN